MPFRKDNMVRHTKTCLKRKKTKICQICSKKYTDDPYDHYLIHFEGKVKKESVK